MTHPCHPLRQLELDISLWGSNSHSAQGIHGEARQLAGQLKDMVVKGRLVSYHGLDVQVNWDILQAGKFLTGSEWQDICNTVTR